MDLVLFTSFSSFIFLFGAASAAVVGSCEQNYLQLHPSGAGNSSVEAPKDHGCASYVSTFESGKAMKSN